jgi:2-oxoglutarate ferredoxin oxidoreductase subunit alpha
MMEKRIGKLDLIEKEVPMEDKLAFFGDQNSENIIFSWGSSKGAIVEALGMLKEEGLSAGFLQVRLISPLPASEIRQALEGKKRIIDIEDNYWGLLGQVVKEKTGIEANFHVVKYTGRPMTTTEVYDAIKLILSNKAPQRQVLMFGS